MYLRNGPACPVHLSGRYWFVNMARSCIDILILLFFSAYGILFAIMMGRQLSMHPLFPFQPKDADWSYSWLMMTVGDYYGVAFALSAIVLVSEPILPGIMWVLLILLLGCPCACAYVVYKVLGKSSKGLALVVPPGALKSSFSDMHSSYQENQEE
eukprot:g51967.t1